MTSSALFGNESTANGVRIQLPDRFEPSWAGPCQFDWGRCFGIGSDDGRILFTNRDGVLDSMGVAKYSPSGSSINGIAVEGIWIAVSTREEVAFAPAWTSDGKNEPLVFPHGAHTISTSPGRHFIAPMGRSGIMSIGPPVLPDNAITVHISDRDDFYCYQTGAMRAPNGIEVMVAALRRSGIGFTAFSGDNTKHVMSIASLPDLDVIDFCQLFPGTNSLAIAALSRDGRLLLFRDLMNYPKVSTFQYENVKGTPYRVFSCHGDVYMATSRGLYMLAALANDFVTREPGDKITTQILPMRLEFVDGNLCWNNWLLIVTMDGVMRFDVRILNDAGAEQQAAMRSRDPEPVIVGIHELAWSQSSQTTTRLSFETAA